MHIVKDKGEGIGNRISEVKKGNNTLDVNELDFKKGWINYKKFLNTNTSYINHSTVMEFSYGVRFITPYYFPTSTFRFLM